jgi:hypothetical protein
MCLDREGVSFEQEIAGEGLKPGWPMMYKSKKQKARRERNKNKRASPS